MNIHRFYSIAVCAASALLFANNTLAGPLSVTLLEPSSRTVLQWQSIKVSASATAQNGDLREHWLEIKRPSGDWSWETNWITSSPWNGALGGNGSSSYKEGWFQFTQPGTYVIRTTADDFDSNTYWAISPEAQITVVPNSLPSVSLTSPSSQTVTVGQSLTISGTATDSDGNLAEHWLEVRRPQGDWNWETNWLNTEPWRGGLNGNGSSSSKQGTLTFTQSGTYTVRTTAMDASGAWSVSNEVQINVQSGGNAPVVVISTPPYTYVGFGSPIGSRATDADGDLVEHRYDLRDPSGNLQPLLTQNGEVIQQGPASGGDHPLGGWVWWYRTGSWTAQARAKDSRGVWGYSPTATIYVY